VSVTLPPQLVDIKPPRGATYDPATRVLRYRHDLVRNQAIKRLRARVAPDTARGTPLELIGYATGPDDPFPVDDRGVDRGDVARRAQRDGTLGSATATASGLPSMPQSNPASPGGYCRLPY
jgi:hypothetical protein